VTGHGEGRDVNMLEGTFTGWGWAWETTKLPLTPTLSRGEREITLRSAP